MTNTPSRRAPAVRVSDLLAIARNCAEAVSSFSREATAAVRDGVPADRMQSTMIVAEEALNELTHAHCEIEAKLERTLTRAKRALGEPTTRKRKAKATPAAPASANVIPFARRARKTDPERPL